MKAFRVRNIPEELNREFNAVVALEGRSKNKAILDLMAAYVAKKHQQPDDQDDEAR